MEWPRRAAAAAEAVAKQGPATLPGPSRQLGVVDTAPVGRDVESLLAGRLSTRRRQEAPPVLARATVVREGRVRCPGVGLVLRHQGGTTGRETARIGVENAAP